MRRNEIERWAHAVIERVRAARPNEDALVELKRDWPNPHEMARRLAGHANAARGDTILWLLGVDPSGSVPGVSHQELANWWPQVRARFDEGVAPDPHDVNFAVDDVTVTAITFDTDRAPYVVTAPQQQGNIQREVPWREGTAIRTARRQDLMRLLVPLRRMPEAEIIYWEVRARPRNAKAAGCVLWTSELWLFLAPIERPTFLAPHRSTIRLSFADGSPLRTDRLPFRSIGEHGQYVELDRTGGVTLNSPVEIRSEFAFEAPRSTRPFGALLAEAVLSVVGSDRPMTLAATLTLDDEESVVARDPDDEVAWSFWR